MPLQPQSVQCRECVGARPADELREAGLCSGEILSGNRKRVRSFVHCVESEEVMHLRASFDQPALKSILLELVDGLHIELLTESIQPGLLNPNDTILVLRWGVSGPLIDAINVHSGEAWDRSDFLVFESRSKFTLSRRGMCVILLWSSPSLSPLRLEMLVKSFFRQFVVLFEYGWRQSHRGGNCREPGCVGSQQRQLHNRQWAIKNCTEAEHTTEDM